MKYDVAVAVKEQQKGKPENWYVAHFNVESLEDGMGARQAWDKMHAIYAEQDDAVLLDVQVLEVKEKLGDD